MGVPYFHVVFTLTARIAAVAYQDKAVGYDLLFKASSQTMRAIAADPKRLGAKIGFTSVLHTWGSAMTHHPHVHMIVPGGGISPDGTRWIGCRPNYLLPVKVLSRLFRRLMLAMLLAADATGVTFSYKDYRIEGPGRYKTMTLKPDEFIRRFLIHVLPNGFHRIRHCGLLASGTKTETIARIRELIAAVAPVQTAHQPQPPDSTAATEQATHPPPSCGCLPNRIQHPHH